MVFEEESEQLVFSEGKLVRASDKMYTRERGETEPVRPNEESGYRLSIKPGAVEVNHALVDICDEYGDKLSFGSRTKAEAFARRLSAEDGELRLQAAAPNDSNETDAYLLAAYNRSVREPADVDGGTWTFDVGANLYGELGETVVKSGGKPPVIEYFVKQDLDVHPDGLEGGLRISIESDIYIPSDGGGRGWVPDCCITARDGWDGDILEQYWCEIKTGSASFERGQVKTMRELASEARVLKIRVDIEELPDKYAVHIDEVESSRE